MALSFWRDQVAPPQFPRWKLSLPPLLPYLPPRFECRPRPEQATQPDRREPQPLFVRPFQPPRPEPLLQWFRVAQHKAIRYYQPQWGPQPEPLQRKLPLPLRRPVLPLQEPQLLLWPEQSLLLLLRAERLQC